MNNEFVRIREDDLKTLVRDILEAHSVPPEDAAVTSDHLVSANLRGVDTHGVMRLKGYIQRIRAGGVNPRPQISIEMESETTALLDGDNSLGQVAGKRSMDVAIEKARAHGIGIVALRNSNHYGMAGHYALMASRQGMIGFSMTNVLSSMAPTGGANKRLGNNPIAFAFPAGREPHVVVDFATSKSSWGRAMLCAQSGDLLPEGCFLDSEGRPTRDAQSFLSGGILLPIAEHKGYGLAMAISILTALLADGDLDWELPHLYKELAKPGRNSFLMGAIRVENFVPIERFARRLDMMVGTLHETPPIEGGAKVLLPGELEHNAEMRQRKEGIRLSAKMAEELALLAREARVPAELCRWY